MLNFQQPRYALSIFFFRLVYFNQHIFNVCSQASVIILRLKSLQTPSCKDGYVTDSGSFTLPESNMEKGGTGKRPMISHLVNFIAFLGSKMFYNYFTIFVILTDCFSGCQNLRKNSPKTLNQFFFACATCDMPKSFRKHLSFVPAFIEF